MADDQFAIQTRDGDYSVTLSSFLDVHKNLFEQLRRLNHASERVPPVSKPRRSHWVPATVAAAFIPMRD